MLNLLSKSHPCLHPEEPCARICRYRLHGTATCALVESERTHEPNEIAKLTGMPMRLVEMALASGMERWKVGMRRLGVRATRTVAHSAERDRAETLDQLAKMLAHVVDVPAHGAGRRLTVAEIKAAFPGVKISTKGRR